MIFILIVLVTGHVLRIANVPKSWAELSLRAQEICAQSVPQSRHNSLMASLVCGTDLHNPEQLHDLLSTQLYHLAVVSGGHLQILLLLLEVFVARSSGGRIFVVAILLIFSTFSGLQPPVLRSLFVLSVFQFYSLFKLNARPELVQLQSGLFCLLLFPQWIRSYSLFLSWWAGFSLCLASLILGKKAAAISKVAIVQLCTGFALGILSGVGVLANWLLAPTLGFILFPAALLAIVFPPFTPIFDFATDLFFALLRALENLSDFGFSFLAIPRLGIGPWISLACFCGLLRLIAIYRGRQKCVTSSF